MPETRLDRLFTALSDRNRRRMLQQLAKGPASVSALGEPLGMGLPSAVKHLAVLEAGGLVTSQKTGRVRTFRLAADALRHMEGWVAGPAGDTHRVDETGAFERIEALLYDLGHDAGEADRD